MWCYSMLNLYDRVMQGLLVVNLWEILPEVVVILSEKEYIDINGLMGEHYSRYKKSCGQ